MTFCDRLGWSGSVSTVGVPMAVTPGMSVRSLDFPSTARGCYVALTGATPKGAQYARNSAIPRGEFGFISVGQGVSLLLPPMRVLSPNSIVLFPAYYDFPYHVEFHSACFGTVTFQDVGIVRRLANISNPQLLESVTVNQMRS